MSIKTSTPSREFMGFAVRVLASIQLHTFQNPISVDELEASFGVPERKITQAIEYLRDNGHKIASSKGRFDAYLGVDIAPGYYIARTPEEMASTLDMIQHTIEKLSSRKKKLGDFGNIDPTFWDHTNTEEAP